MWVGNINEAPTWTIDNHYIYSGYWINYESYSDCVKSTCQCHNQTMNIWTHLLGMIFFLFLMASLLINHQTSSEVYDKLIINW